MKKLEEVSCIKFFDAVADSPRGGHQISKKDDIVVHILIGPDDTIIIPIKDIFEDLPAEDVGNWLIQTGLIELIPLLIPNHPMAKIIRRLPPRNI